jgi:hypothetical protein
MSFKYVFYTICVVVPIVLASAYVSRQDNLATAAPMQQVPSRQVAPQKDWRSPRSKRTDEFRKKAGDNLFSGKCYLSKPTATGLRRQVPENCIVYYSEDFVALEIFGESAFLTSDDVFVVYEEGKGGEFWRDAQTPEVYAVDGAQLENGTIILRGGYSIDVSFSR